MANGSNDPKIRIPIELPAGDMSGAEQAKREIEEVQDAAAQANEESLKAQRDGDAERAKQLKAERETAEAAKRTNSELTQLVNIERAKVAADVAGKLSTLAGSLRELGAAGGSAGKNITAVAGGVEALSDAANGAAQGFAAGGPMGAAIGAFVGLLSGKLRSTIKETVNDLKALEESQKNAIEMERRYRNALQDRNDAARASSLSQFFGEELARLNSITDEIERQTKLLEARRSLEAAQRATQKDRALANGADPGAVNTEDIVARVLSELKASTDSVVAAENALDVLSQKAASVENNAKQAGVPFDEVERLQKEAAGLRTELEKATGNLANLKEVEAINRKEAIENATREIEGTARQTGEGITESVKDVLKKTDEKAKEDGIQLGALAQQSYATLLKIISDKIPDEQQTEQIAQLMRNLMGAYELRDQKFITAVGEAITKIGKTDATIDGMLRQLQELNRKVFGQ